MARFAFLEPRPFFAGAAPPSPRSAASSDCSFSIFSVRSAAFLSCAADGSDMAVRSRFQPHSQQKSTLSLPQRHRCPPTEFSIQRIHNTILGNNGIFGMPVPEVLPIPPVKDGVTVTALVGTHLKAFFHSELASVIGPFTVETPQKIRPTLFYKSFVTVINLVHSGFSAAFTSGQLDAFYQLQGHLQTLRLVCLKCSLAE